MGDAARSHAVRYVPSRDAATATVDGEAIVLNVASGVYFGLNPVATRIWHLIGDGAAEDSIVRILLAEYEVEEPRLRADVVATLRQLESDGLVDVVPA